MFNRDGVTKTSLTGPRQILANVELQAAVGCIVSKDLGVEVGARKIAKAGTPIIMDFGNLQTVATAGTATGESPTANAVLLHDVDVTTNNANGTALYLGVVNINRLDTDVQAKVEAGINKIGAVSFIKA